MTLTKTKCLKMHAASPALENTMEIHQDWTEGISFGDKLSFTLRARSHAARFSPSALGQLIYIYIDIHIRFNNFPSSRCVSTLISSEGSNPTCMSVLQLVVHARCVVQGQTGQKSLISKHGKQVTYHHQRCRSKQVIHADDRCRSSPDKCCIVWTYLHE